MNPFAEQFAGDTISIAYFSGNPNPQALAYPELVATFKNLMRKDPTTREKAAVALKDLLPSLDIDEDIHLAFIQLYLKLAFDDSALVRTQAHQVLGIIYAKLGRKSTKHLSSSLPCLLCGLYDPIQDVSQAATATYESTFSTPERRELVVEKFNHEIQEFCKDVLMVQTPQTISDERYISKQESSLKYDRIVKQVMDVLQMLSQKHQCDILREPKLWKFAQSSNVAVSKAVYNLATAAKQQCDGPEMVQMLVKGLPVVTAQASTDLVRALLSYVRDSPELLTDAATSQLAAMVKKAQQFPPSFWPLFYNLVLVVEFSPPISKALASCATKALGPSQNDIWSCFLSLCSRSEDPELAKLAADTLFERCKRVLTSPLVDCIASRFKRLNLNADHVERLLQNGDATQKFNFALCLCATELQEYHKQVSAVLDEFSLDQVAKLVQFAPYMSLEKVSLVGDPNALITISSRSGTVNHQEIAEQVAAQDSGLVLRHSGDLAARGVHIDFTQQQLDEHMGDAILAHGGLITTEQATHFVQNLAKNALEKDQDSLDLLVNVSRKDPDFIRGALAESSLGSRLLTDLYIAQDQDVAPLLETLHLNDSPDILVSELLEGELDNLDVLIDRAVKFDDLDTLLLLNTEWLPQNLWPSVEAMNQYPVIYEYTTEDVDWARVLRIAIYLLNICHQKTPDKEQLAKVNTQVAIVAKASVGVEYSSADSGLAALASAFISDSSGIYTDEESLWTLLRSNDSSAFYAAQILYEKYKQQTLEKRSDLNDRFATFRTSLEKSHVVWALAAALHVGGLHWYDRYQQEAVRALQNGKQVSLAELSCAQVDQKLLSELSETVEEPLLQATLIQLQRLGNDSELSDVCIELSLEYGSYISQLIVVNSLVGSSEYTPAVLDAVSRLNVGKTSKLTEELLNAYLAYTKSFLHKNLESPVKVNNPSNNWRLAWISYVSNQGYACAEYRKQLESNLENTKFPVHQFSTPQDWLLYLDLVDVYYKASQNSGRKGALLSSVFEQYEHLNDEILDYVQHNLAGVKPTEIKFENVENVVGDNNLLVLNLLFRMCGLFGSSVRTWYRSLGNRKMVDKCLADVISPAIMRSLSARVQALRQDGALESTSISEKGREFRAMIDIDETVAQIVITLDPLFPVKTASVELVDLAGVPQQKKRSWTIEAEYTVQSGAIVAAMRTLLLKLSNFLDGIEPCAICYSVMLGKSLPSKTCSTCKNTYHSDCLYQWFHSNKSKLCPMCRTPF